MKNFLILALSIIAYAESPPVLWKEWIYETASGLSETAAVAVAEQRLQQKSEEYRDRCTKMQGKFQIEGGNTYCSHWNPDLYDCTVTATVYCY